MPTIINISRCLDHFLDNLIIIPILAINLSIVCHRIVLALEHIDVELVYFLGVRAQDFLTVLLHPDVED